jgi:hypothetical protein
MLLRLLLFVVLFAHPLSAFFINEIKSDGQGGGLEEANDIVLRMQAYSRRHREAKQTYSNIRRYHLEYRGLVKKSAEMVVRMIFTSPDKKQFEIKSESGSKLLRNRVLHKLLESEVEASQGSQNQESAITSDNYRFRLLADEVPRDHGFYVLEAIPRRKAKYLFIGKIWVDGRDFAITRIEGRPAVNPSWWIKEARILQTYRKVGDFWFYDSNESTSGVRIGGQALLRIRYEAYEGPVFCDTPNGDAGARRTDASVSDVKP